MRVYNVYVDGEDMSKNYLTLIEAHKLANLYSECDDVTSIEIMNYKDKSIINVK